MADAQIGNTGITLPHSRPAGVSYSEVSKCQPHDFSPSLALH